MQRKSEIKDESLERNSLQVAILAAGQGKRMYSRLPKVLHTIAGMPMLQHVITAALALTPKNIHVVYGHQGEQVRAALPNLEVNWVHQAEQLGTGHAVAQVLHHLNDNDQLLVLFGDTPLVPATLFKKLISAAPNNGLGIVTAIMPNPTGLGRVVRNKDGDIQAIIEEKDANVEQRAIQEIFTGILTAPVKLLREWLPKLKAHNAQGEFYLTEIIEFAVKANLPVVAVTADYVEEVQGVNDRKQLAMMERFWQQRNAEALMLQGITLRDPNRFDVRGNLKVTSDVTFDINVICEGDVSVDEDSQIGPNCLLRNCKIGKRVTILANTVIDGAIIADDCIIGPFARIRPGTELNSKVHIGNFVELKKSKIGSQSKVNHLSYVGDATVGSEVNIGAGTITCNYDGFDKYETIIGDRVQVGSDTTLVAPITLHDDTYVATASTLRHDVPAGSLAFNSRQEKVREGWTAKKRAEKAKEKSK